jgi:thymidylate synthase
MVSAWNVGELDQMTLPPCHYGFQVYTRKLTIEERKAEYFKRGYTPNIDPLDYVPERAISLIWNQRSVDTFLGLPFNMASYGLLLEIIAKIVNMVPDELIGNLGDIHLYEDHLTQAREQLVRKSYSLPKLEINDQYWVDNCGLDTYILSMLIEDFQVKNYESHPTIKAPLIN